MAMVRYILIYVSYFAWNTSSVPNSEKKKLAQGNMGKETQHLDKILVKFKSVRFTVITN